MNASTLETIKALKAEIKQDSLNQQAIIAEIKTKEGLVTSINHDINQLKETIRVTNRAEASKAKIQQRDAELRKLRTQLNALLDQKQELNQAILDLQHELSKTTNNGKNFKSSKLQSLLKQNAQQQATATLHAALKRSGLLKAIKEALALIRVTRPEMRHDELNNVLMKLLVDAVTLEHPTFDDALNALNEQLEKTPTQETTH